MEHARLPDRAVQPERGGCPPEVEITVSWAFAFGSRSRSSRIARTTALHRLLPRDPDVDRERSVGQRRPPAGCRRGPGRRRGDLLGELRRPRSRGSSRTSAGCASVPSAPAFEISAASRPGSWRRCRPSPPASAAPDPDSLGERRGEHAGGPDHPASRPSWRSSRSRNFWILLADIGHSVDEADVARDLEARDPAPAEVDQLLLAHVAAVGELDERGRAPPDGAGRGRRRPARS